MSEIYYTMEEKSFITSTNYGNLEISGEDDYGFRPYFLMVSSVVGCFSGTLRMILETSNYQFEDIEVKADVTRKPEEVNRIEKINLNIKVKSEKLQEKELDKVIQETYEQSSMSYTVRNCIGITTTKKVVKEL